jgi:hypothetical protein
MKQITNKTILKQGDKTYQPIEHDGNIHWVDSSILVGMEGDWVVETHNPVVISVCQITKDYADLRVAGYKDMKVVAQSQPNLSDIPVVNLDSYVQRLANKYSEFEINSKWGEIVRNSVKHGFKSNPNQYTQADIEKAIELAREADSIDGTVDLDVVLCFGSNNDLRTKWTKEEILEQINSISVIEVDEQFNILGYG